MWDGLSLSATEAGLLTIAERRGSVITAKTVDRNDVIAVERKELLERLVLRGMLIEDAVTEEELAYAITDSGREALKALDARRPH